MCEQLVSGAADGMTIVARTPTVAFLYFALMIFHVHECTLEARVTTNRWDVPPQGVEYQACSVRVFTSAALIDYIPQHQMYGLRV